jgi:hypothetical protein
MLMLPLNPLTPVPLEIPVLPLTLAPLTLAPLTLAPLTPALPILVPLTPVPPAKTLRSYKQSSQPNTQGVCGENFVLG